VLALAAPRPSSTPRTDQTVDGLEPPEEVGIRAPVVGVADAESEDDAMVVLPSNLFRAVDLARCIRVEIPTSGREFMLMEGVNGPSWASIPR
jgi:hypothetical protein